MRRKNGRDGYTHEEALNRARLLENRGASSSIHPNNNHSPYTGEPLYDVEIIIPSSNDEPKGNGEEQEEER